MIKAYSQNGNPEKAISLFRRMIDRGFRPTSSTFGRSGELEKALDYINNLPIKPTASIWKPLLAACRCHNNLRMAELVAKNILAMDPDDATVYVTLSNMYAEVGQLVNAENQRKLMKLQRLQKNQDVVGRK
ncbi:hypothetical protein PTKIN_Ptkin03bG0036700 [Pterospermum kingtungense]